MDDFSIHLVSRAGSMSGCFLDHKIDGFFQASGSVIKHVDISIIEFIFSGEDQRRIRQNTIKALSDPTRLNILQYLAQEPHSPAQLAKRLRLRAPTITHHLRTLRLARLVRVVWVEETHTTLYATRSSAIDDLYSSMQSLLKPGEITEEKETAD